MNDPQQIRERFQKTLQAVIDAGACPMQPTTVIDLSGDEPVLVRAGRGDVARLGLSAQLAQDAGARRAARRARAARSKPSCACPRTSSTGVPGARAASNCAAQAASRLDEALAEAPRRAAASTGVRQCSRRRCRTTACGCRPAAPALPAARPACAWLWPTHHCAGRADHQHQQHQAERSSARLAGHRRQPPQTAAVTTISTFHCGLASCACTVARGGAWPARQPGFPDLVHAGEVGQVGEEDLAHQDARLVAAGARQQRVDRGQHLARLAADVLRGVAGHLAGQVAHAVVHGHLRQARADVEALNRHLCPFLWPWPCDVHVRAAASDAGSPDAWASRRRRPPACAPMRDSVPANSLRMFALVAPQQQQAHRARWPAAIGADAPDQQLVERREHRRHDRGQRRVAEEGGDDHPGEPASPRRARGSAPAARRPPWPRPCRP